MSALSVVFTNNFEIKNDPKQQNESLSDFHKVWNSSFSNIMRVVLKSWIINGLYSVSKVEQVKTPRARLRKTEFKPIGSKSQITLYRKETDVVALWVTIHVDPSMVRTSLQIWSLRQVKLMVTSWTLQSFVINY